MKKTPVSRPSEASVVRDYVAGKLTLQGVCAVLGVSTARVRRILAAYNVEIKSPYHRRKRGNPDEMEEVNR